MTRGMHQHARATDRAQRTRTRVAQEAARLMSEQGIRDFRHAKRKAAQHLGLTDERHLPRNQEIEHALRQYQRLFVGDRQQASLRHLRQAAVDALPFFAPFHARLVGPVLTGTADQHSAVCLQLYCDAPESVQFFLAEHGIPFTETTRRIRMRRDAYKDFSVLQIEADGTRFDLTVLPELARRQAPLDPVDEQPMPRASAEQVRMLLDDDSSA